MKSERVMSLLLCSARALGRRPTRRMVVSAGIISVAALLVVGAQTASAASTPASTSTSPVTFGTMNSTSTYLHANQQPLAFSRASHSSSSRATARDSSPVAPKYPCCGGGGYSGTAAAAYADNNALGFNQNYRIQSNDCANFVSQALSNGGMPLTYQQFGPHYWWYTNNFGGAPYQPAWTDSWVNTNALAAYLLWDNPGGIYEAHWGPTYDFQSYTPNSIVTGDVIFYNWYDSSSNTDHVSMQVGIGVDPDSGFYGNLVDEHTNNRRHAFWSLYPYNAANASTTWYQLWHISAAN